MVSVFQRIFEEELPDTLDEVELVEGGEKMMSMYILRRIFKSD